MSVVVPPPPRAVRAQIEDTQQGFAGGLNSVADATAVGPDQMVRADNVRLAEYGAATKRGGTQRISTGVVAAFPVRSGYAWTKDVSTVYGLIECNATLYSFTWGALPRTFTSLGAVADVPLSCAAFRDGSANVAYIADGTALRKWNGTTLSSVGAAVVPTGVTVYHERLWAWGVAGSLDSIFYSALDNGDTLGVGVSGGGQIVVRTMGQRDVVACAAVNTSLMIWHHRGISRLTGYGQSDIEVVPESVTSDAGLVGPKALAVYDNVAYFVSDRGVFKANESQVTPLATPKKPDPVAPMLEGLSAQNLALITCIFNRRTKEVWVQLPGIGIYVYQTILQSWSGPFVDGYLDPDTTSLFEMTDATDQPIICRGDASGWVSHCEPANVWRDNVLADGSVGTIVTAAIQLHRMYGNGEKIAAVGWLWAILLAAVTGTLEASLGWNTLLAAGSVQLGAAGSTVNAWGAAATTWGTGTWGSGGQAPFYVRLSGAGPFVDLTIVDSGEAAATYSSCTVQGVVYGRR